MSAARTPSSFARATLVALLCVIWGSTWIVIRGGLDDLPPLTSAGARFLLAALVMSALAPWLAPREGGGRAPLRLSLVVGVLQFGVSYAAVYWAETRLPSGIVSVLWAVNPLLMAIATQRYLRGEKLDVRQWTGLAVGFGGVALLFFRDLDRFGAGAVPAALVLFVSPLASAIATTIVKRQGEGVSSVELNRNGMWIGAACLCAAAFALERDASVTWTGAAIGSVAYLAVIGTVVAFGLYFWLLRHTAAHRLSLISYVTPAIALLLGAWLGGEELTRYTIGGSVAILIGVALVVGRRR
ncbi:MAG: DMT family transporter [Planctomycetota bacterium]